MARIQPIFFANVKDGKILFEDKDMLKKHISSLEGKDVDVIIRTHRKDRTHSQNNWYWSCVVAIPAQHFGYTINEMHNAFKLLFLMRPDILKGPRTMRSTTELSTTEFSEYVENCRRWCSEQGLFIPDPCKVELDSPIAHEAVGRDLEV